MFANSFLRNSKKFSKFLSLSERIRPFTMLSSFILAILIDRDFVNEFFTS